MSYAFFLLFGTTVHYDPADAIATLIDRLWNYLTTAGKWAELRKELPSVARWVRRLSTRSSRPGSALPLVALAPGHSSIHARSWTHGLGAKWKVLKSATHGGQLWRIWRQMSSGFWHLRNLKCQPGTGEELPLTKVPDGRSQTQIHGGSPRFLRISRGEFKLKLRWKVINLQVELGRSSRLIVNTRNLHSFGLMLMALWQGWWWWG